MLVVKSESTVSKFSEDTSEEEIHLLFVSLGIGKIFKISPSRAENKRFTLRSVSIKSFSN